MIRPHRSGIALILVISLIGLMGITLGYLSHSCRIMLLQTDRCYLKAVERNLTASGLTWARETIKKTEDRSQKSEDEGRTMILDVNELRGPQARLIVRIEDGNGPPPLVHVQTHVSSARQKVNRLRSFRLQMPSSP
jgi:type II secretory pathway component PulK